MRYSYEYKRRCVEMYRKGEWPETPDGIQDPVSFRNMIRRWVRIENENGPEALNHKESDKKRKAEEKLEPVSGSSYLNLIYKPVPRKARAKPPSLRIRFFWRKLEIAA